MTSVSSHDFLIQALATTAATNRNQGASTSPRCYQRGTYRLTIAILLIYLIISVNMNTPQTPTRRSGTHAPPLYSYLPSSLSQGHLASTIHTENHAALPTAHLDAPSESIKTPQQVTDDLLSISDVGPSFYIVTRGREPGIYTDW